MDLILNISLFPCVSAGWDDTPRFPAKEMKDVVYYHNTPKSFAALLSKAKEYADSHSNQPKLITERVVKGIDFCLIYLNRYSCLEAEKW